MRTQEVWAFARERHSIHLRREAHRQHGGEAVHLTDDPILQRFRFCNVYRELDTVTAWLRTHWREPYAEEPDLWHAFVLARHHNTVPFLEELGIQLPWDPESYRARAKSIRDSGIRPFSAAYMVRSDPGDKIDYIADRVLTPMWEQRERVRPAAGMTLNAMHMELGLFYGLSSFMAGQVVADMRYVEPLRSAPDWDAFCPSGPGSRRGLNRWLGLDKETKRTEDSFRLNLTRLRHALRPYFENEGWEAPHGQDVQNLMCEFDKYERARLGEGRPKQLFRG